ncbi:MAG: hypothetical protein HY360_10140 [Verrucomicrobia bacterium]|nr:hypothetical protein [Verrucomicrobiota bacterium]
MGDGVLAVFNYPPERIRSFTSAVLYGIRLIREGGDLLKEFSLRSTTAFVSGTRVGFATGDVWPINAGYNMIQLSFIGKPVNFVARLEKCAEVDGMLLCRETYASFEKENPSFAKKLGAQARTLSSNEVGFSTSINVQAIQAHVVAEVELN